MKKKIATLLVDFIDNHKILVSCLVILLTVFSVRNFLALSYSTSISDLLPSHNQIVKNFLTVSSEFGISEDIIVNIHDPLANTEDMELYLDIFIEKLQENKDYSTYFKGIDYSITQKLDLVFSPFFLEHAALFLPENKLPTFIDKLTKDEMEKIIQKNRMALETGITPSFIIEKDPLNLLSVFAELSGEVKGRFKLDFVDGYYFSKDHRDLILFLKTKNNAQNVKFVNGAMELLTSIKTNSYKDFLDETDDEGHVKVGFTGAHAIAWYDRDVMKNDMSSTFFLSFLAVIFLFVIAYKNPFSFIYAAIPLILGEIWTFGAAYLIVDSINILTGVTSAIIVGLGIDFSIHIYSRFLDEYYYLSDTREALIKTLAETGSSTLAGGLTTAAAFSAMIFSSFKGLQEFGVVASLGILAILFSVFVVLPLLFLIKKKMRKPKKLTRFGLHFFHPIIDRYYKEIFVVYSVVILIFLGLALNLKFNTNMRQLRSMSNPAIQLQTTLTATFGASFRPFTVVLTGQSEEELEKLYGKFTNTLSEMNVARVESIYSIVPSTAKQMGNINYLKARVLPKNIEENFYESFNSQGLTCPIECKKYIESLAKSLQTQKPLLLKSIIKSKMYPLFANMLKSDKGKVKIALNIFPKNAMWNKVETSKLIAGIQTFLQANTNTDENFISGITILVNEIKRLIKDNYYTSSFLALFLVFLIVFFHYNSLKLTLISFFPLATGLIAMLGMLKLTNQDITLFNFIATPMLIGIGIDDGIHIFDRFLASGKEDITEVVVHTGKAITFTSLTTIIGFGSLFASHFEGFASLGLTTIYGVFFCWFSSLFYFPAFLKLTYSNTGKHIFIGRKKKQKRLHHLKEIDED